jgi:hypothetical protein
VKIKTLYTYCKQVGRRGKDYETKRNEELNQDIGIVSVLSK